MEIPTKWLKHNFECPEGKGQADLLSAWRVDYGIEVLIGVSCNNPQLKEQGGEDCQWSCLKEIEEKKASI